MSRNGSERFVCPYYQWDRGVRIGCEGGCRVGFADVQSMEEYIERYCGDLPGWERCSLAAARNEFYARQ